MTRVREWYKGDGGKEVKLRTSVPIISHLECGRITKEVSEEHEFPKASSLDCGNNTKRGWISYFACKFFERVRVKLTSHCKTTRGLLAMDLAILNLGQVTRMTPELSPPSPNYHTTPTGGASTYLRCIAPLHTGSWVVPGHD
ncbi:hypothetical protein TNCV_3980421 [Trichonephila clavipes]|nr:hypothetical protein TNCV_3980421 [Trichonephila clavipes]